MKKRAIVEPISQELCEDCSKPASHVVRGLAGYWLWGRYCEFHASVRAGDINRAQMYREEADAVASSGTRQPESK